MTHEVFQNDDGRWKWEIGDPASERAGGKSAQQLESPIDFGSEQDARTDLEQFLAAERDNAGKRIRPEEQIQWLIQVLKDKYGPCRSVEIVSCQHRDPDSQGCNWSIAWIRGESMTECLSCMEQDIQKLRAIYNLPAKEQVGTKTEVEYKGYTITVMTRPAEDGQWNAFVMVNRAGEPGLGSSGFHDMLTASNEREAMDAALVRARQKIDPR